MGQRVPVRDGLFVDAEVPRLLVSQCVSCGKVHFPRSETCPYCAGEGTEPKELTGPGVLWAHTSITAAPPGYLGEVPYGVGVVEFDEGIRIISRLSESDPFALREGQMMELVVVPLHTDDDGNDVVTYAFAAVKDTGDFGDTGDASDTGDVKNMTEQL